MEEGTKYLIAMVAALGIILGSYAGICIYSSVDPPFSVIQSESMQHSQNESAIGILDTGDMVLVRDPSKVHIRSYVEGRLSGYSAYGDYGDVIIYKRQEGIPVIHRAMLWLDNNGNGTWTAKALEHYPRSLWDNGGRPWNLLKGDLTLHDVGYEHVSIKIRLSDSLGNGGFLTKGDNAATNPGFDQSTSISPKLIAMEDIKSVPVAEIPWLGCVKLYAKNNNVDKIPANSLPSLAFFFIAAFSVIPAGAVAYQSVCDLSVGRKNPQQPLKEVSKNKKPAKRRR